MLDEVQSGNGRCGSYFAFQHTAIKPDVVTTAKGLGNGLPIGACLSAGKAADLMKNGNHGSTYGGNHLVCAAALEVVDIISKQSFLDSVIKKSDYFKTLLEQKLATLSVVKNIRVYGLMIGIELSVDCPELVQKALDKGLLINVTNGKVIRLLPPLIISQKEIEQVVLKLEQLISTMNDSQGD